MMDLINLVKRVENKGFRKETELKGREFWHYREKFHIDIEKI